MDASGGKDLVRVAYANDRAEADMIKGLLESASIPSIVGFGVFLLLRI